MLLILLLLGRVTYQLVILVKSGEGQKGRSYLVTHPSALATKWYVEVVTICTPPQKSTMNKSAPLNSRLFHITPSKYFKSYGCWRGTQEPQCCLWPYNYRCGGNSRYLLWPLFAAPCTIPHTNSTAKPQDV